MLALCAGAAVAAGGLSSSSRHAAAAPAQEEPGISPEALAQIETLIAEKESRTGAERKIDSQLIYEMKMQRGEWITSRVPTVETDIEYADVADNKVVVDIKADVSPGLLSQLRAGGADVLDTVASADSIRASVPLDNIEAICAVEGVDGVFIGPADLHASLGYTGEIANPKVKPLIDDAIRRIRKAGKAPGILTPSEADARHWLECGALFVAVGADVGILARGAEALAAKFKST
jgi:hypothetical protein